MKVTLNGEPRELPADTSIAALLELLKLTPRQVAVELNKRLVKSEKYATPLKEGDTIEVVTFVGGG